MSDLTKLLSYLEETSTGDCTSFNVLSDNAQNTQDDEMLKQMSQATGVEYSEEQLNILRHRGGMCILACAGSGKTTILTHLLAKRILTGEIKNPETLLCTTYSKAGANEMDERLNKLLKTLGIRNNISVKTLHAMYLEILKKMNYPTDVIDGGTRLRYISDACKDAKYRLGDEDLQQIDTLLSFQINNLLSDAALVKSYIFNLEDMTESQYTEIRTGYNKRKMAKGQIDFDDMQLYVYSLLIGEHGPKLIEYCNHVWTDFYIDEAQDVSKIQFEILRRIIKDGSKLVFIGDDDQCIYEWRGADPSIILNIGGYYDISKFVLSTNYRCCSEIVNHAAVGITNNSKRSEKTMKPHLEGGQIRICDTKGGSLYNMTKYAYQHIKNLIEVENVKPSDIAVLSRNNQHLCILNSMLYRAGIYCSATADMKMTKSQMYKDIKNVINMATNGYNHSITASTLWRICIFLGVSNSIAISKIQDNAGLSLVDTLGYILKTCCTSEYITWNKNVKIPKKVELQVKDLWSRLRNDTIDSLITAFIVLESTDEKEKISGLISMYHMNSSFLYKSEDRSRSILGLVEYIIDLIDNIGVKDALTVLRVTEQYEEGKMAIPGDKVTMSTMHGSKGREWKHVLLFADDNITFPSFDGIRSLVEKKVSMADISASIDENRRLHYVAMTRAKSDLTIFTDLQNISVYTAEALGVFTGNNNNLRIINMANNGMLDRDIKEGIINKVTCDDSKYKYELDISNLENKNTIYDVGYMGVELGVNINSLQTSEFQN